MEASFQGPERVGQGVKTFRVYALSFFKDP